MKKIKILTVLIILIFAVDSFAKITVKLKDISYIDGLKENQVFGYGLVVGLAGTGDSKSALTKTSLRNVLKNLGLESEGFISKNSAAVLLTAKLPAFVRIGDRVDITVSSIGDAKSLKGGILIQSSLKGANNKTYIVAQGALEIPEGKGKSITTVARITNGGFIERKLTPVIIKKDKIAKKDVIAIVLRNWDYTLANKIIKKISNKYPSAKPVITQDGKIKINIQKDISLSKFISTIQNIEITPIVKAKIVIDEKTGTIVTGGDVKISVAMISQNGITVEIKNSDKKGSLAMLNESGTLKDLVETLNSIGASTNDIISILKALKTSGAIHGELIIK